MSRVLGVHPSARGFGWILFEGAQNPLDWGVVERRVDRNAQCLQALDDIIVRYSPSIITLEAFENIPRPRVPRVRRFCRRIVALGALRGVSICLHPRGDVRMAFAGVISRQEVAVLVAQRVEPIRARLPKKRALWQSERPNMALFNAAAVALTCHAFKVQLPLL